MFLPPLSLSLSLSHRGKDKKLHAVPGRQGRIHICKGRVGSCILTICGLLETANDIRKLKRDDSLESRGERAQGKSPRLQQLLQDKTNLFTSDEYPRNSCLPVSQVIVPSHNSLSLRRVRLVRRAETGQLVFC